MSSLNTTTSKAATRAKARPPISKTAGDGKATAAQATTKAAGSKQKRPSHAQVAARAYEIWLSLGRPTGRDDANWRQAEQELIEKLNGKAKARSRKTTR